VRPSWSSRGLSEEARVNLTPLIDVVMCLIVFYLMVGRLVIERRGETDLPQTAVGLTASRDTDPLAITVPGPIAQNENGEQGNGPEEPLEFGDRTVLVDGVAIPVERLGLVVSGRLLRDPGLAVQVRADKSTPYSRIEPVLAACRDAGVTSLELATRQESSPTGGR
jgi:biopolymer transport protein ExbD